MVPDFASTAHMIQGNTLDALLSDAFNASAITNAMDQVGCYVSFSRVKTLAGIFILQSFSPWLFSHGVFQGPHVLLRKLRGELSAEEAAEELARLDSVAKARLGMGKQGLDPMKQKYMCMSCFLQKLHQSAERWKITATFPFLSMASNDWS